MNSTKLLLSEGKKLTTFRKLMGLKQKDIAKQFDTDQGNYSKMERGREFCGERLHKLQRIFYKWREGEVERLQKRINYLNAL